MRYTDPSGHTPVCVMGNSDGSCKTWAGLTGVNAANGFEDLDNDVQGNIKIKLTNLGIYGDEKAAMEYIVKTEFNSATLGVMTNISQASYLFEAMTRRYQNFCKGGSWSGTCLQSFWGYHQGPLTGASGEKGYTEDNLAVIGNIASAIMEPGKDFNGITANSSWTDCKSGLCHYAIARGGFSSWVMEAGVGPDLFDSSYSIDNYLGLLYMYPQGGSDYFVVFDQAMFDMLNIYYPDYLWNGN